MRGATERFSSWRCMPSEGRMPREPLPHTMALPNSRASGTAADIARAGDAAIAHRAARAVREP